MRIYALLFDLEGPPQGSQQLIAWIDEYGCGAFSHHAHPNKTLLDVEPGHVIVHRRRQYVVSRVKPYRTSECCEVRRYPWVRSGRVYLQGTFS